MFKKLCNRSIQSEFIFGVTSQQKAVARERTDKVYSTIRTERAKVFTIDRILIITASEFSRYQVRAPIGSTLFGRRILRHTATSTVDGFARAVAMVKTSSSLSAKAFIAIV